MTHIHDLMDHWYDRGIHLWEDEGQLRFRAPRGTVDDAVLQDLKTHKDEILEQLRVSLGPRPDPEHRYDPFPLTDVQGAYLMGRSSMFDHGGVACHLYCEVEYPRVDPERAVHAWRALVQRHDMLRVRIDPSGYQQVLPEVPDVEIPITVLPDESEDARSAQLERVRSRLSHAVHPVGSWPMFGVEITQPCPGDDDASTVIHISYDFLLGDWASLLMLIRDWEQEYAGDTVPAPGPLTFRDHVVWERRQQESSDHRRSREYWLDRVDGLPRAPQLPHATNDTAQAGPATADAETDGRWTGMHELLPRSRWESLASHARDHGVTPTAAVLACYADVLGRWAIDPHFCLNLTVLDRPSDQPELAEVIGDFTTVTLLETRVDTRPFEMRAREVMEQLFTDFDHRSFSGVEVMREIARTRGREAAEMPYVFTSAIGLGGTGTSGGPHGTITHSISQTPQAVLDCQVMDDAEGLHVHWDTRDDALDPRLRATMFHAFVAALAALADSDEAWVSSSPVHLPAREREERERANDTACELPGGTLHGGVLAAARATPGNAAVIADSGTWTYAELVRRASDVADALARVGVARRDRVAIAVPRSPQQIAAVLGTLLAGAAYVPLDVRHPSARRAAICVDAGASAVLHTSGYGLSGEEPGTEAIHRIDLDLLPDATPLGAEMPVLAERTTGPDDLAYVIFTSGSSGRPKGVEVSHRAAMNTVMDIDGRAGIGERDRTLAVAELSFDLSVYDVFGPLCRSGAIVLPPPDTVPRPATWCARAAEHEITLLNTVPAVAQMMLTALEGGAPRPGHLHTWILSGDRVPGELVRDLRTAFPRTQFVAMGGATEAAIWSIAHPISPDAPYDGDVPYGLPLANQRFGVLDALGRDAPVGVPGEIVILGAGLAEGYTDPTQTRRRFIDDPLRGRLYRTGDLGRYLPGGEIAILGRIDDQVKIRGHRIEPGEVETVLLAQEEIDQAAVMVAGQGDDRALHAVVVSPGAADPAHEDLLPRWVKAASRRADTRVDVSDGEGIAAYAEALDAACVGAVSRALRDVREGAPVAPAHAWVVDVWEAALGTLGTSATESVPDREEMERRWQHLESLRLRGADHSGFTGYVRRSAEQLPALLAGHVPPSELLFPEGARDVAERVYQDRIGMRWGNAALSELVRQFARRHTGDHPLRVLEVGAGTGSSTDRVREGLADIPYRYTFTDRSAFFLPAARERWDTDERMSFGTFDVDRDPLEQGLEPGSFDMVCAFGVLENARNVPEALRRLTTLTRSGGTIMLSEPVEDQWWVYVSQIFLMTCPLEGSRPEGRLFPSVGWWGSRLQEAAGGTVVTLPEHGSPLSWEKIAMLVARVVPDGTDDRRTRVMAALRARLPEVMLPRTVTFAPRLPLTPNGKIDRRALEEMVGTSPVREEGSEEGRTGAPELSGDAARLSTRLGELWTSRLGLRAPVGADTNPFDVGANSISAAAVAGAVREEGEHAMLSFETVLRVLLGAPTIAEAALELVRMRATDGQDVAVDGAAEGVELRALGQDVASSPRHRAPLPDERGRLCAVFGDTMRHASSVAALGASLGRGFGTPCAVVVPQDEWFLAHGSAAVTDAVADLAADALIATGADEFCLIGYSYGALVAIETARRLIEQGHRVLPLGLVDPHVVPIDPDDRLSELMFLTAQGADLTRLDPRMTVPPLQEILERIVERPAYSEARPGTGTAGDDPVDRLFSLLGALDDTERWDHYRDALDTMRPDVSATTLRGEWCRYRHTMRAATHTPDLLVADAVVVQPRGTRGFLPGSHERALETWQDVLIGTVDVTQVDGDHFTVLTGQHAGATGAALTQGLRALLPDHVA
jgi:pyochelin synthetase